MIQSKKEQIFQAVISHIKQEGLLNNLTIAEIAKKADVGKGTVYEYFNSKDEIIAETIIYMIEQSAKKIFSESIDNLDYNTALTLHIKSIMEISHDYANLDSILMSEDIGGLLSPHFKQKMMDKVIELKQQYREYLNLILNKGTSEHKFNSVNDPYIIYIIANIIMSSTSYYLYELNEYQDNIDGFIEQINNLILKIIR